MTEISINNLTSKKLLLNNSLISMLIQGGPVLIAFFTIPVMIKALGTERFGLLTLIWSVIGASSILDFGLGNALTQFVSRRLGLKDFEELPSYIMTAVVFIFSMGIFGAILIYSITPMIVNDFINTKSIYISDTINSFRLLTITIPFLMINICLIGMLAAYQKFTMIGVLKIPVIFCNYIAPLFVLCYSKSLIAVVSVLVIGRMISCAAYFWFSLKIIKSFSQKIKIKISYIKPLLAFGGWITVSNIVNNIVVNIDRFIIAGLLSAQVVAFYTTPLDTLTKIWMVPNSIMSVMYPAFSSEFFTNRERAKFLYFKCLKTIFFIIFPICFFLFIFAKPGISIWLGAEFAEKSSLIAKIIIPGVLLQGLNVINYSFIQSTGKSEIQAKIHLVELPVYLISLWFFIKYFGITGAAMAWLFRIVIDFTLFNFFAYSILNTKMPAKNIITEPSLSLEKQY